MQHGDTWLIHEHKFTQTSPLPIQTWLSRGHKFIGNRPDPHQHW
jgi:hypothetical protein